VAIEKFTPSISGEIIPYVQANTHVIQNITNAEALAVWIYLLTLPKDWLVMKAHVKKHFKMGDDKIKRIFAYLNKQGLIEYIKQRDSKGRMGRILEIRVLNGSRFVSEQITTGVKSTPPVIHTSGKHPTTKDINKQIKEKEKKKQVFALKDQKINNRELKQTVKFWEPGNPDYDRVHRV
jgi:hypothetical protein